MAYASVGFGDFLGANRPQVYAEVDVPPRPNPRRLLKVLRDAFRSSPGPADRGLKPERVGR